MVRKAKVKRKMVDEDFFGDTDYKEALAMDRMEKTTKEVNANTDDEGNPIATKDKIYMTKLKSAQTVADQRAYEQKVALPGRIKQSEMEDLEEGRSPQSVKKRKAVVKRKKNMGEPNENTYVATAQQQAMEGNIEDAFASMNYGLEEKPKRKVKVKSKSK